MKHFQPDPIDHTSPWAMEKNFWLEGPNFFRAHMKQDATMTLPGPVGTLHGEEIIAALRNQPRLSAVAFSQQSSERVGRTLVLRYVAAARRDGVEVYRAKCTSIYGSDTGGWVLMHHEEVRLD